MTRPDNMREELQPSFRWVLKRAGAYEPRSGSGRVHDADLDGAEALLATVGLVTAASSR